MIELLLIAQIATGDHYCYMETPTGAVVNLAALCGVGNAPMQGSDQGFVGAIQRMVKDALPGTEDYIGADRGWDVESMAQVYCQHRRDGLSQDDYFAAVGRALELDPVLANETVAVTTAVVELAPQYFCPEFND